MVWKCERVFTLNVLEGRGVSNGAPVSRDISGDGRDRVEVFLAWLERNAVEIGTHRS